MTVSSTTKRNSYTGNGSTTTFAYSFKIFDDDDITVILRTTATGTETVQTKTTHYSVTGVGNSSGGNVVFGSAPTSAQTVVLLRQTAQTQATDYTPNDPFPAASHEDALDKLTLMAQDQQDELDRSIKLSRTNTMTSTEFTVGATDRANKVLGFDGSGELTVTQELGTFRGDFAASTSYSARDIIRDTSTGNIFIVNEAHTSSGSEPLTSNANSAKYTLLIESATAGVVAGTVTASRGVIVDSNKDITGFRNITLSGELTLGSGAVINEAELEAIDGVTAGTVAASKAVVVDSNKDAASFRNITLTGELDAGSLDVSGDADIDGTLEADAITVNGTALNTVIAGVTVTDATNSAHVLVTDNESTNEENLITFVEDATSSTGNVGLEMDGNLTYNPSTGTVTATVFKGNIDAVDGDFDGTLEADAITLNGTAITATATLDTGISNNNVPKFTSGVADNDFLRVDGTAIEGRSASEVLSDIAAAPAAGDSNIVTTGALNSGSITSGFGAIDNGSSNITTTGVGSFGSLDISGDIDVDGTTNLDAVDIDGNVDIATTATLTCGAITSSISDHTNLTLISTAADGSLGPKLNLVRDSSSPADGDNCGQINFKIDNDAGQSTQYGDIFVGATDVTDGSESAHMTFSTFTAGTRNNRMKINTNETVFNEDSVGTIDFRVESDSRTHMLFVDSSADAVGIGTSAPNVLLHVFGSSAEVAIDDTGAEPKVRFRDNGSTRALLKIDSSNNYQFHTGPDGSVAEVGRFSSAGVFMVGKTSASFDNDGFQIQQDGMAAFTRDGAQALYVNRRTSEGPTIEIRQDNDAQLLLGSKFTGRGYISTNVANSTGLRFDTNFIAPCDGTGTDRDNVIDLGSSSSRFDDIHATNSTIQTSDENEKQNITSLSDSEITAAKAISKLFKTFKFKDSVTAKGDAARTHTGVIAQEVQAAMSAAGLDATKYAFWCSDTWWETSTEVEAVEGVDAVYEDVVIPAVEAQRDGDGGVYAQATEERTERRLVKEGVEARDAYTRIGAQPSAHD